MSTGVRGPKGHLHFILVGKKHDRGLESRDGDEGTGVIITPVSLPSTDRVPSYFGFGTTETFSTSNQVGVATSERPCKPLCE